MNPCFKGREFFLVTSDEHKLILHHIYEKYFSRNKFISMSIRTKLLCKKKTSEGTSQGWSNGSKKSI
jgi:hypothetical protein